MTQGLPDLKDSKGGFCEPLCEDDIGQMIRVNQAGEFGAKRIYEGQLKILGQSEDAPMLEHMLAQELEHLKTFNQLMVERQVRPTVFTPVWRVAGFALGAMTAWMGKESAMACTAAVEEVIDEHYARQEQQLGDQEPELKQFITKFRAEENEHKELSLQHGAEQALAYPLLSRVIKGATRTAIWLSKKL